MRVIGRPELAGDARFRTNADRAAHADELDALIEEWTCRHPVDEVLRLLEEADVPVGLIYSITDIVRDPQYRARGMLLDEQLEGVGPVRMPGLVPKLSATPGRVEWYGDGLGSHNHEVYAALLGLTADDLARLSRDGVI